jgi:hypothetical protein
MPDTCGSCCAAWAGGCNARRAIELDEQAIARRVAEDWP